MKSLAVSEQIRLAALRRPPGLLLAGRPRLRVGADAARPGPGRRRRGLEPARLGPADRQDPPRPAAARGQPPAAKPSSTRPAGRRRVPLHGGRRAGRGRGGDRQDRAADRAELAAAAATVATRHHRRPQRGAAPPEPRRHRLEPDAGAGRQARRGQRACRPPIRTGTSAVRRAQPVPHAAELTESHPLYLGSPARYRRAFPCLCRANPSY